MRSHALHTHTEGAAGACEAALAWVRAHLYADQMIAAKDAISFSAAKISRADIHIDWQGGYAPALSNLSEELRCYIRPGRVKGALYFQGGAATGIQFGRSQVVARLYNKTLETKEKGNDTYTELLTARCGEAFDPQQDLWRLEFELKREGTKGFRLYAPPEEEDADEEVEAEMNAEELQHIGMLPRFFARKEELFLHLTRHWLRLVEESDDANRSRWPMHPTWQQLREAFGTLAGVPALDDEKRRLARGARYRGRMRLLRRMEAGVIRSLEVEDASPTSTALMTLQRWVERVAEKEVERITVKCRRYQEQGKPIHSWVRGGMDERFRRVEQIEQRVQMLLGIFASHGVLPLEFKPAYSVGDLLLQHLDALEQEAEEKGGVQQMLADHFAKVYKASLPATLAA
jgi:AcrR family transcriptional regulator